MCKILLGVVLDSCSLAILEGRCAWFRFNKLVEPIFQSINLAGARYQSARMFSRERGGKERVKKVSANVDNKQSVKEEGRLSSHARLGRENEFVVYILFRRGLITTLYILGRISVFCSSEIRTGNAKVRKQC